MEKKQDDIEFKEQKIVPVNMGQEVKTSFINYAMSVIMSRALPDVRDGFKPVHRRILYAMYEDHLTYDKPFRKSATTVGNVLGRYHPHGDTAVYDTMVRMAQDFSLRYPLVDGHGNFGNIDGDSAAAYRYTEARMSKLADHMLTDIEKDVVDFTPNFDNKLKEPVVLPARFPNLLVNGSIGIAVGMATNIPTHNLGEIIDGVIYLMDNPDATTDDLMQFIKAPDFPTGAIICGLSGVRNAYETGKGHIKVRARATVDEENHRIIVTEIPYQVNKVSLVEGICNCANESKDKKDKKDKKVDGITDVRDESGKDGLRIVIEYRRDVNGHVLLNQLYKYTRLEDTFAANMLALVDNVPRVLGLKAMLNHYIEHQENITVRRLKYELEKAKKEAHILEGLKIASDNIDDIIALIKGADSIPDAKAKLCDIYGLTEPQAQAIVEMTLGKLTGLERAKIEERLARLEAVIFDITDKLSSMDKIKQIIKDEITEIKNKFADPRRTEISFDADLDDEDLIDRHTCVITMTHSGYLKRMSAEAYNAQARGGKGVKGITTKEEDFVETVIACDTHSDLMMFTSLGKVFTIRAYKVPEASRIAKGINAVNVIEIEKGEKITSMISVSDESYNDDEYLLMVTKKGTVKRTALSEFAFQRKKGKKAINLDEDDELVYVRHTSGQDAIVIASHDGNAVRFDENNARVMGRGARGVRGIRLGEGDYVVGCVLVDETKKLLTMTENGFGKRSGFDDFRTTNRGGKGVRVHGLSDKTGKLAAITAVEDEDDIVIISDNGITIRTHVRDISEYSRTASGVIVMRTGEGKVSAVANVGRGDDTSDEQPLSEENEASIAPSNDETKE
ncbi:MAG: DNA gyrase subunit A [Clostridia bacterium]|nr:DNA gyrase subunit A [Clostridia bacterium]